MSPQIVTALVNSVVETLYMVGVSGFISVALGIPLGVALMTSKDGGLLANKAANRILAMITNTLRSIPFLILLIALIPITRFIVGTSIGTTATIVPLTIGAIPFVARLVENSLLELTPGLIEAGKVMGGTPLQIIYRILLTEAMPSIVNGITVTLITLVGYSAMAGTVGGGGLGDLAYRYGFQRFEMDVMLATIVILIIIVQAIQLIGDYIAKRLTRT